MVGSACGYGAALTLAAAFGGAELYIPTPDRLGEEHPLALALGLAVARAVAKAIGHGKVIVPLGPLSQTRQKWQAYSRMAEAQTPNAKMARALGVHQRTIERYNARVRDGEDPEPDLFD
jgi:ActR/RegA family two-component response regulator